MTEQLIDFLQKRINVVFKNEGKIPPTVTEETFKKFDSEGYYIIYYGEKISISKIYNVISVKINNAGGYFVLTGKLGNLNSMTIKGSSLLKFSKKQLIDIKIKSLLK